jgi:hypothetical protein
MILDRHKTASIMSSQYHGKTVIELAIILEVLSIPNDTKFVRLCLALVSIVWYFYVLKTYCQLLIRIENLLSGIGRYHLVLTEIAPTDKKKIITQTDFFINFFLFSII